MAIRGIQELYHTSLYRALETGLMELAASADQRTVSAARSKPIEDVRYNAGVADGVRLVIAALKPEKEQNA